MDEAGALCAWFPPSTHQTSFASGQQFLSCDRSTLNRNADATQADGVRALSMAADNVWMLSKSLGFPEANKVTP